MAGMKIILDGDSAAARFKGREFIQVKDFDIVALAGGMESGKPSVALVIELPDERVVFAETSLALLLTAADAFKGRHGDPRSEEFKISGELS